MTYAIVDAFFLICLIIIVGIPLAYIFDACVSPFLNALFDAIFSPFAPNPAPKPKKTAWSFGGWKFILAFCCALFLLFSIADIIRTLR